MVRLRRFLARWGLLDVALVAALLLTMYEHRPQRPMEVRGAPVYTVHQVVAGLARHPGQWLGRTVWVWGAWAGLCQPYPNGGCTLADPGQSAAYLAASAWNRDETLSLNPLPVSEGPPARWAAQEWSQQPALYQIHLARLQPGWCPWTVAETGPQNDANPSTTPCVGGELVP